MRTFYVYITASVSKVLYIGVTSNLKRRTYEHKNKVHRRSFTARYNVDRLVYFETYGRPMVAIRREKQLKGWLRSKKIALIEDSNPAWQDRTGDL